jgi:hypothetical protein
VQELGDGHDTLSKELEPVPLSGLATIDQLLPFHDSARVWPIPEAFV